MSFGFIGSPPHTWRIQLSDSLTTMNLQDHLHIRGEYADQGRAIMNSLGSPPHTWRIPSDDYGKESALGITSTYVENTIDCFN